MSSPALRPTESASVGFLHQRIVPGGAPARVRGRHMRIERSQFLQFVVAAVAVTLLALSGQSAFSQTPRTIKIIVAASPGGSTDILARLLADRIGRAQSATVVVENRTGASGVIGTEAVSRAAPDGNTLLMATNAFVINPHLREVNYDPITGFEPVCRVAASPEVIVVNSTSPYRPLSDLLNAARAKPGELTLAAFGPASSFQIAVETLKRAANVNVIVVPYPGESLAASALLGEHVTSAFATYAAVPEHWMPRHLRPLAPASRKRIELLPNVPTVAESAGYRDYEAEAWFGLLAPAKTPKEMVSQLSNWFTAAAQAPEIKAKLATLGLLPRGM